MKNDLVSVSQLARIKGHSSQAIRKAIKKGRIKAFKVGSQWVINIRDRKIAKDAKQK